jgi:hypothetical protein
MALKRRIWIAGPVLGMLVAMVVVLPPRSFPVRDYSWNYGRVHRDAVERALNRLRDQVEGTAAADSLARLAQGAGLLRSADGLITVLYERNLARDSAQRWLEWLSNELALVPGAAGAVAGVSVPIVVALHSDSTRWTSATPGWGGWYLRRQIQGAGEQRRCVVELRLQGWGGRPGPGDGRHIVRTDSGAPAADVLGWCALYARFGAPGSAVDRWSGISRRDQRSWYGNVWSARTLIDAARDKGTPQRLPAFLFQLASCAGGNGPACTQALGLDRTSSKEGWSGWWYGNDLSGLNSPTRDGFLTSLLATEPPGRFAALWSSNLPVSQALVTAYGRDAGELVMRWAQRRFEPTVGSNEYYGRGVASIVAQFGESRGGASEAIASFGWAALLLGVGALLAKRQQADS